MSSILNTEMLEYIIFIEFFMISCSKITSKSGYVNDLYMVYLFIGY